MCIRCLYTGSQQQQALHSLVIYILTTNAEPPLRAGLWVGVGFVGEMHMTCGSVCEDFSANVLVYGMVSMVFLGVGWGASVVGSCRVESGSIREEKKTRSSRKRAA